MAGPNKHLVGGRCGAKNTTGITHFTLKGTGVRCHHVVAVWPRAIYSNFSEPQSVLR